MEIAPIIKPDGAKQRIDVSLTVDIASTLAKRILAGEPIYTEERYLDIDTGEGESMETRRVASFQIAAWLQRDTVIPGDGRTLKSVLNDAREERKRLVREQRQLNIIENAEVGLAELVRIPITSGKEITRRYRRDPITGLTIETGRTETEFEGVNPKLAEAKTKALSFALERLEPQRYAAKSSVQNTHLIFSLADLRRAKERRDELTSA